MRKTWMAFCVVLAVAACGDDEDAGSGSSNSGSGGSTTNTTATNGTNASAASTGSGGGATTGGGGNMGTDTWANFAEAWFATYCTSCHPGNGGARDHSIYANVVTDAPRIRCGVAPTMQSGCGASPQPNQFPVGNGANPDSAARLRLVAWIDDGMPQ